MTQQSSESRGTGRFDQGLYEGALKSFLDAGAPQEVADKAAKVVARDNPDLEDFGRTDDDQGAVHRAWCYLIFGNRTNN